MLLICRKRPPPPAFHPAGWAEYHSSVTHFSIQVRKLFHTRRRYSHLRLSSGEHQKLESSRLTFVRQKQENVLYQFSASLCGLVPRCSSSSLTSRSPTCALYIKPTGYRVRKRSVLQTPQQLSFSHFVLLIKILSVWCFLFSRVKKAPDLLTRPRSAG